MGARKWLFLLCSLRAQRGIKTRIVSVIRARR